MAFVDFQKGDESAHVRLNAENTAQAVFDKLEEGKVSYYNKIVDC